MARTPRLLQEEDVFFDEDDDPNAPDLTLLKGSGKSSTWEWELVVDGEVHNFETHYSRTSAFPFLAVASTLAFIIVWVQSRRVGLDEVVGLDEDADNYGSVPFIVIVILIWCICAPLLALAGFCCRWRDPPLIMYQVRQTSGFGPHQCHATPRTRENADVACVPG